VVATAVVAAGVVMEAVGVVATAAAAATAINEDILGAPVLRSVGRDVSFPSDGG
jgi:hypothetical protein